MTGAQDDTTREAESDHLGPHPWYGPCDWMGPGKSCSECLKLINELNGRVSDLTAEVERLSGACNHWEWLAETHRISLTEEMAKGEARIARITELEKVAEAARAFADAWMRGDYTVNLRDGKTDYTPSAIFCAVIEEYVAALTPRGDQEK